MKSHRMLRELHQDVCFKESISWCKESGRMGLQSSGHLDTTQVPKIPLMDFVFTIALRLAQITSYRSGKNKEWRLSTGTYITVMVLSISCNETKTSCWYRFTDMTEVPFTQQAMKVISAITVSFLLKVLKSTSHLILSTKLSNRTIFKPQATINTFTFTIDWLNLSLRTLILMWSWFQVDLTRPMGIL